MGYYIFDEVSPNRYAPYLELPDEIDLIESIMGKQPTFDELPIKMFAEVDEDVVYTDIINPGVPLFSLKMKEALDRLGVNNINYYPVLIVDEDTGKGIAEYFLGVVTDIVSCLDIENSKFKEDTMGKKFVSEFCIDESKTRGLELFRFHNIPGLLIINQDLKDKLFSIEFTGVSFKHTSEYKRGA